MNLQPSNSTLYNERRILFAWELTYGGTGQFPISASAYELVAPNIIYAIDFLEDGVVSDVGFRTHDSAGNELYNIDPASFIGWTFPAGTTWTAPITSITLSEGRGLAYTYEYNTAASLGCCVDTDTPVIPPSNDGPTLNGQYWEDNSIWNDTTTF
jgi:hypothetical protein